MKNKSRFDVDSLFIVVQYVQMTYLSQLNDSKINFVKFTQAKKEMNLVQI